MKIYADTSVLIAWFHPADRFALPVTNWCRHNGPEFHWNALLRAELRHNLRKLTGDYAAVAWQAYRASEAARRLVLARDKTSDLMEWADELSARFAAETPCGTWDCTHVAAALHARADVFATCDVAQARLAKLAKFPSVKLFKE
jgi:predicted nucleic acid-binding protein